jgi:CDP-glycerol glycerophosphotransferase (TagB/SpsB family)/glycosyltransferase involved in cell wall biosynthesis
MAVPRLSVVVPFYNNADQLGDCLTSIAEQTMTDLAVIMVDDGSTDGSADIAAAQAAADSRFTLLGVPNGGPGSARNHGVAAAAGELLAFVDADDLLPPDAYATLVSVLDEGKSDFVCGGVLRLTAAGLAPSGLHDQAIKTRKLGTHISRSPELCYDISVWNKLFRRSFWDNAGLRFPEGMLWEDLVAMTKAHVLARSVDVVTDPVYHWRDRDKGAPSITQSRTSIANFRDRITALGMIDDFLRDRAKPSLLRHHQDKALVNDLWLYVRDLPQVGADYQCEFITLAASYLRRVDRRVSAAQPTTRKLAYYLISRDRQADLVEYARWLAANPSRTPPMVRSFGLLRADLPLRAARGRRGGGAQDKRRGGGAQDKRRGGGAQDKRRGGGAQDKQGSRVPASVFRPRWRELDPQVQVDSIASSGRSLVIEGSAYVPSIDIAKRTSASKLVLLMPRTRGRPPILLPARSVHRPDVTRACGQNRYSYDWAGFRCHVHPRWFGMAGRWLTGEWDCFVLVRGRSVWRPARLHTPGQGAEHPHPIQVAPGVTLGARWVGRRLRIRLTRQPQPSAGPPAISQGWTADGKLLLRGTLADPTPDASAYRIVLRQLDGWARHVVPITAAPDQSKPGSFDVEIPVAAMDVYGDLVPLRDGRWSIELRHSIDNHSGELESTVPATTDNREVNVGGKAYRCAPDPQGGGLLLRVGPELRPIERGRIRRRLLRDLFYPLQRWLPLRDSILLVSFDGHSCTDSPLAIADELRRRGDQREQIWVVRDRSTPVPANATSVLIGTADYFAALGRSRYLIANDHLAKPHRGRPGQRYVQTWHGTPLKRLGYDIVKPTFASGNRFFDFMAGDVAQWNLLISPNPFSTPIMRQAFNYAGEISETGYPRNDALLVGQTPARTAQTRRRLGLPPGKRVAMYVPTWRDNQHDGAVYRFELRLDLAEARRRLADDFVLLIRGHHLMAGWELAAAQPGFVFDVTGYPDINDLLGLSDVLITDYSSVMFDFAPTGRPMLFFTYDLEHYRDQLRGFYFDFESDAPGPLLATSDQVVAALADIDAVAASYRQARAEFTARFCPLDDGKASARACDRIFRS